MEVGLFWQLQFSSASWLLHKYVDNQVVRTKASGKSLFIFRPMHSIFASYWVPLDRLKPNMQPIIFSSPGAHLMTLSDTWSPSGSNLSGFQLCWLHRSRGGFGKWAGFGVGGGWLYRSRGCETSWLKVFMDWITTTRNWHQHDSSCVTLSDDADSATRRSICWDFQRPSQIKKFQAIGIENKHLGGALRRS